MVRVRRQFHFDDVLHHRRRLDDRLRVQNGNRVSSQGLGTSASASASGAAEQAFTALLADPFQMLFWMVIICGIGFFIVGLGLQNGVERVTKVMMACLFVAIVILAINSVMLPGAHAGLEFYLMPDFGKMIENGFGDAVYAAMGQAFFTLSIGASGMAIFGSYIGRDRRLTGEAASVAGLSTLISLLAGLIIFPACFAYGVSPDSGPNLVFVTRRAYSTKCGAASCGARCSSFL